MWWAQPLAGDAAAADDLLDDADRARRRELRRADDRSRFVTGRVLARRALAAELGIEPSAVRLLTRCPACGGPHGKPRLVGPAAGAVRFSIAHAGDDVLVATCRGAAVGVDVEPLGSAGFLASEQAGVLAAAERAVLRALAPERRDGAFMRYWTRKEALLKATGHGLTVAPDTLHVSAPDAPPVVLAWPAGLPAREARLCDLDVGRAARACVAVLTAGRVEWSLRRVAAEAAAAGRR